LDIHGHLIPSMQAEVAEVIDDLITPIPFTHPVVNSLSSELQTREP
jgi:hypothetical protein